MADPKVRQGLEFIKNDDAQALADLKEIVIIPAPPFKEKVRGEYYQRRLQELGLKDLKMDTEGNVYGIRPGTGHGPKLLVEAHLDTVFPEGTNLQVIEKDGRSSHPALQTIPGDWPCCCKSFAPSGQPASARRGT